MVVIILLALRPVASIVINPLIALPVGGVVCALACGQIKNIREYAEFGLGKVVATCSRSRLKNSRLVYQTVGGYFCVL